jgi:hypothetical protein
MRKYIPVLFASLFLVCCGQKGNNTSAETTGQQDDDGSFFSGLFTNNVEQTSTEEPDLTFADFANAEVEPFQSFVERERLILQQAANMGSQGRVWWFADSADVCAIIQFYNQYANSFSLVSYTAVNPIEFTLLSQGQDAQGNYVFEEEMNKALFVFSADESWLRAPNQSIYRRVTAAQCDEVMTYAKRRSLYLDQKYWVFTDLFQTISKSYSYPGIDADRDMRVWGNRQGVYALVYIPSAKCYAFAEYRGWTTVFADGAQQGTASDGSINYLIANNSMNLRTNIQLSADGMKLTVNNASFQKINIRTATRLIEAQRDEQDKNTTPEQFDQMYQTYVNLAARQMQTINNLNVKEVYKFSVRSNLRDAQIKMREIRQRALKIGYQMQPNPYEGQDPSYDPGQRYQYERDGVRYGVPKY